MSGFPPGTSCPHIKRAPREGTRVGTAPALGSHPAPPRGRDRAPVLHPHYNIASHRHKAPLPPTSAPLPDLPGLLGGFFLKAPTRGGSPDFSPFSSGAAAALGGRSRSCRSLPLPGESFSGETGSSSLILGLFPSFPKSRGAQLEGGGVWRGLARGGFIRISARVLDLLRVLARMWRRRMVWVSVVALGDAFGGRRGQAPVPPPHLGSVGWP